MAFWGERFRRKDEEDIWEELRQMLINAPSQNDILQQKRQEQAEVDALVERMFPDLPQSNKEPYLRYEDLVDIPTKQVGTPTGMAVPVLDGNATSERYIDPILEEINSKVDWSDELKAQKMAEVSKIQENALAREKEINREHLIEQAKNYGGAALENGSAAIPGMLGTKVVTGAIKTTKPLIEQIIRKNVARGGVEGLVSGAIEGLGHGLLEDENLLKTTAQGSVLGGVTGTALGKIAGEAVAKTPKIKDLDELLDKRNDWGIAYTKQSGKPEEAIEKLLEQKQGFVPKATSKDGIGDIDFVWGKHESPSGTKKKGSGVGIKHILERRNEQGYDGKNFVKDLPVALDGGNVYTKQNHPGRYYIGDGSKEAVIRTDYDGKKRHWLGSAYYLEAPSQASTGFRTYDRTTADKQFFPLSDLRRNSNIISPSQTNLNPTHQAIKTPMSFDEWLEELKRKRKRGL